MVAHRTEFPAASARGQQREERKQREHCRVRRGQVEPACRARFALAAVQRDQEIRTQREQLPADEEVQSIGRQQHERHAQHEEAPPETSHARRARMRPVRPILARVRRSGRSNNAQQEEEEGAHPIEAQEDLVARHRKAAAPTPLAVAGQHLNSRQCGNGGAAQRHHRPRPRRRCAGQRARESRERRRSQQHTNRHWAYTLWNACQGARLRLATR